MSDATRYPNLTAALAAEAQRVGRLRACADMGLTTATTMGGEAS